MLDSAGALDRKVEVACFIFLNLPDVWREPEVDICLWHRGTPRENIEAWLERVLHRLEYIIFNILSENKYISRKYTYE